jgi:ribosome biogenesis GTPase
MIDPFELDSIYGQLGYRILKISVKKQLGLDQLKSILDDNTTVLSGVSGVGKSSITSELRPDTYIKIAEISSANEEGRHTTRTSRLYHLPNDGQLIDTPGVRGFNPLLDPTQSISAGFREIDQHSANCRFANCKHINEPKCAVIEAVKKGEIAESRYRHYLRMLAPV